MASVDTPCETKDAYLKRLNSIVSHGFITLGIALGTRLGLFEALAEAEGEITVGELAARTSCKPRYVKEWLGLMVVSGLVETNEAADCFQLPEQGKEAFKSPHCEAAWAPFVIYLSEAYDELLKCFTLDGPNGIPFKRLRTAFDCYHLSRSKSIDLFITAAISQAPGLQQKLESGAMVCDIGCCQGQLQFLLSPRYPKSTIVGVDILEDMIAEAKTKAAEQNIKNVEFHAMDACSLPDDWSNKFDYVTLLNTLHDIPHASTCAKEAYRILKPGGCASIKEVVPSDNPKELLHDPQHYAMEYAFSLFHCLPQSMYVEGSEGLGLFVGIERLESLLRDAGFQDVSTSRMNVNNSDDLNIIAHKQV